MKLVSLMVNYNLFRKRLIADNTFQLSCTQLAIRQTTTITSKAATSSCHAKATILLQSSQIIDPMNKRKVA
jgi:hypothetical protein